jgi:glycosyltransferase involved in cell wall biosynthesis
LALTGISVVTTTWNEKGNIEKLILTTRAVLKHCLHELIVVDDSSSDGTVEIAKHFADVAVTKPRGGVKLRGCFTGCNLPSTRL